MILTDISSVNGSRILLQGIETGTGDCFTGNASPPPSQECLRLDYQSSGVTANAQTCFTVVSPATATASASISCDIASSWTSGSKTPIRW